MTLAQLDRILAARSTVTFIVAAALLLALLGLLDMLTGPELSFSVFYLAPIVIVTWYAGFGLGALTAVAAALVWLAVDRFEGGQHSQAFIPYWNMGVRLLFFLIVAYLLARLEHELRQEESLARTDMLTGLPNSRHFHQETEYEIQRAARYDHPFSVAYVDLDDFKAINDNFGHLVGDEVLREVANCLRESLRRPDIAARLGGDEFAILLPETDVEGARAILNRLQGALRVAMRRHAWPVTFSIGAMTFLQPPESVEDVLQRTDRLMYTVKSAGKNDINLGVYRGATGTTAGPAARNR